MAHRLSCSTACGIFLGQGSNPCSLHWQAYSQPLRRQGSPSALFFISDIQIYMKEFHTYIYYYFLFLKVLAQNSGYDLQETLVKVQVEHSESKQPVGIDLNTGKKVKKNQLLNKKRGYTTVTQNLSKGVEVWMTFIFKFWVPLFYF